MRPGKCLAYTGARFVLERAELRENYRFVFGLFFDYSVVIFEP